MLIPEDRDEYRRTIFIVGFFEILDTKLSDFSEQVFFSMGLS